MDDQGRLPLPVPPRVVRMVVLPKGLEWKGSLHPAERERRRIRGEVAFWLLSPELGWVGSLGNQVGQCLDHAWLVFLVGNAHPATRRWSDAN